MIRLWIVRHGDTFEPGEPSRRIGARTDMPLVERGLMQAQALRTWFAYRQVTFDRALGSRLRRTYETAVTIAPDATIEIVDWLAEIDHGPDEGQPEAAVVARIGKDAIAAWDRDGTAPSDWIVDRDPRLSGWRGLLAETPDGRNVLLVTSNGAARFALLADPTLARLANALPSRKLRTGAFGLLTRAPDEAWRIETWDQRP